MKTLICALVILCSVILSTVFVSIYSNKLLSDFNDAVEAKLSLECDDALANIDDIKNNYEKLKPFLILFMRENDMQEMEMYIEDVRSAAKRGNQDELTTAKNRLQLHIEQLRRQSAFSIETIF